MKRFGIFTATVALAFNTCWSADAAPRPIAVAGLTSQTNNVNDPVNHPYQQSGFISQCAPGTCQLTFQPTTAPETLVQHVSCQGTLPSGVTLFGVVALADSHGDENYLHTSSTVNNDGTTTFLVNEDSYVFASSGDQYAFFVTANGGAVGGLACFIEGYHN